MKNLRCTCGGGRVHHENDRSCWCPRCLQLPESQRCTAYAPHVPVKLPTPPTKQQNDQNPTNAPHPSSSKTLDDDQRETRNHEAILRHLTNVRAHGATVSELTALLGMHSRSVSAALKALHEAGTIEPAQATRRIGDTSEDIWQAVCPAERPSEVQMSLWA